IISEKITEITGIKTSIKIRDLQSEKEKLFEELFVEGETYHRTCHEKIFVAQNASSLVPEDLDVAVNALVLSAQREDREAIIRSLQGLVAEYTPMNWLEKGDRQQVIREMAGKMKTAVSSTAKPAQAS
ncbi:MAG: hypothetical protein D6706_04580, partial [Chloroflexi bacterium]